MAAAKGRKKKQRRRKMSLGEEEETKKKKRPTMHPPHRPGRSTGVPDFGEVEVGFIYQCQIANGPWAQKQPIYLIKVEHLQELT
jgi:hypothetical protein